MAAEDLLNLTGLAYFKGLCDTKYSNKIESVKVNGTEQPITNKAVDLDLTNYAAMQVISGSQANFVNGLNQAVSLVPSTNGLEYFADGLQDILELASKDYVDANGGKIDKIKVNDTEQTVTNKEVNLKVPTITQTVDPNSNDVIGINFRNNAANDQSGVDFGLGENILTANLYDSAGVRVKGYSLVTTEYVDTTFRTEAQVQTAIDNALADITGVEFRLVDALPATGESGIFYLKGPVGTGTNLYEEWIWLNSGTTESPNWHWENIGTTAIDLSGYVQKSDINIITTAQIDALFAA